jgi:hypothetical protein
MDRQQLKTFYATGIYWGWKVNNIKIDFYTPDIPNRNQCMWQQQGTNENVICRQENWIIIYHWKKKKKKKHQLVSLNTIIQQTYNQCHIRLVSTDLSLKQKTPTPWDEALPNNVCINSNMILQLNMSERTKQEWNSLSVH